MAGAENFEFTSILIIHITLRHLLLFRMLFEKVRSLNSDRNRYNPLNVLYQNNQQRRQKTH